MPVGYTALKTVASLDNMAPNTSPKGSRKRGHAAGTHGKCACCKPLGKVCSRFCRLSALTKCLVIAVVALFVVTGVLLIGGASLTGPASSSIRADRLCSSDSGGSGKGAEGERGEGLGEHDDPTVPLIKQNVYAWYLANTGIIVTLTIFSSCVCCVSYVGLCCDLPSKTKIFGAIGITLVAIMFTIYTAWMMGGFYLVVTFDTSALFTDVCRNVLAYTLLLGVYFVTVCVVGVVWCVWRVREVSRRERSTPRQRVRGTKPQFQVL